MIQRIASWLPLLLSLLAPGAFAQQDVAQDFGAYRVHYSVFNSGFIDPEIAGIYQLTRSDNIGLVNIALTQRTDQGESLGLPAQISGRIQNLLGQTRDLEFVEIREGDATYYLASFRISDQDPLHFFLSVTPSGSRAAFELRFTRTLYDQ